MIETYKKGVNVRLSDDFETEQFDCQCDRETCDITLVDRRLVDALQSVIWRYPIITINSGFRCEAHNKEIGGGPSSQHKNGKAADIRSPFARPDDLAEFLEDIEVFKNGGIGVYKSFVHCDVRGTKARWRG